MSDYTPRPDSLAWRVRAFFRAHPEEELSARDIAQKFDVPAANVAALLGPAIGSGMLARSKDDAGTNVYVAGANVHVAGASVAGNLPAPPRTAASPFAAPGKPQRITSRAALPEPAAVVIEQGVYLPPANEGERSARYAPVFERMAPGDSFTVPTVAAKRMVNAARYWAMASGAKFKARQVDAGTTRIWRTE